MTWDADTKAGRTAMAAAFEAVVAEHGLVTNIVLGGDEILVDAAKGPIRVSTWIASEEADLGLLLSWTCHEAPLPFPAEFARAVGAEPCNLPARKLQVMSLDYDELLSSLRAGLALDFTDGLRNRDHPALAA